MTEEGEQSESYDERARRAKLEEPPKERESRGGGGGDDGPDPDAWMVTFSDLLTLLMTFFVLIFASSDPVQEKFYEAFGQSSGVFGLFRTSFFEEIVPIKRRDISQDRLQVFLDEIGATDIEVSQEDRGLVITLPSQTYFNPGNAVLTGQAMKRITQLSELLKFSPHNVRVEGHTDNREARRSSYQNPWELSTARAHAVLLQLIKNKIAKSRLSLVGYGASHPRFDNVSRLGRQRNRRVEIVILNRGEVP